MWQAFRNEHHAAGFEVVTVALDTAGPEACRRFIELGQPEHPSLIDEHHRVAELFGVVNIPNAVWAVGPAHVGGRTLVSAEAPELTLPDLDGNPFQLSSLRGQKVLMVAWSPY